MTIRFFSVRVLSQVSLLLNPCPTLVMPSATIEDLRRQMRSLGEEPPKSWSAIQIRARIVELKELMKDSPAELMDKEIQNLKRSARKKTELQMFARELGVTYAPSDTIAVIYGKTEKAIMEKYEPTAKKSWDLVSSPT